MKTFNALDIETFNKDGKFVPYCICIILYNENIVFYGDNVVDKLFNFLNKKKIIATLYVHNLTFDGSILIENLKSKETKIKGMLFRSNIYELIM
jgi:hypothetical protein